jgi:hypothetical protein
MDSGDVEKYNTIRDEDFSIVKRSKKGTRIAKNFRKCI